MLLSGLSALAFGAAIGAHVCDCHEAVPDLLGLLACLLAAAALYCWAVSHEHESHARVWRTALESARTVSVHAAPAPADGIAPHGSESERTRSGVRARTVRAAKVC